MKKITAIFLLLISSIIMTKNLEQKSTAHTKLQTYKTFLENGTYEGQDWSSFIQKPKSRYHTFKVAFTHFEKNNGKIIVELGTTRSFVNGSLPGCNSDNPIYWQPHNPAAWDWGAGFFTRTAAECLIHLDPIIYTVDIAPEHIQRCKIITSDFSDYIRYYVCSSLDFLRKCDLHQKIDLLYLDTGNITPIEATAHLHLQEAQIIVERDLIAPHGIILIDDVKNQTPKKFGEQSDLGKAKYSIPFFLANGFEIVENEYQVILRKVT